jgi:hypothetical protein
VRESQEEVHISVKILTDVNTHGRCCERSIDDR